MSDTGFDNSTTITLENGDKVTVCWDGDGQDGVQIDYQFEVGGSGLLLQGQLEVLPGLAEALEIFCATRLGTASTGQRIIMIE